MNPYLKALEMKYEADIEVIQLNLKNYLDNAVAVGTSKYSARYR